ncbi:MAG: hypothetical protein HUJ25_07690 [Crocinitomicaceae bacterium]|nr:hypothetical protein [Crocinitomicaceae bacterium]
MKHLKLYALFTVLFLNELLYAQKPREIQVDNDPVNWQDPATIVVLIIIPVVVVVFYIFWIKWRKNQRNQRREED